MQLTGPALVLLIVKIILAIFSFLIGAALVAMGISLIKNENGRAGNVLSKFKFWGIDLSSPSGGLVVVVVSLAWGMIGLKALPNLEFDDGHIKISLKDISKPVADIVAVLKAPDGRQSPGIGEVLTKFEDLANRKYLASSNTTVETHVAMEQQEPVFKLRASSDKKTIEEQYTASYKDGTIEFTPFGVSAVDNKLPNISMKFDCTSSLEAFYKKLQADPKRSDLDTHKRALKSLCPSEIHQLPNDKQIFFEDK